MLLMRVGDAIFDKCTRLRLETMVCCLLKYLSMAHAVGSMLSRSACLPACLPVGVVPNPAFKNAFVAAAHDLVSKIDTQLTDRHYFSR
eukprot:COSAG02_NODE_9633_length_2154_cov_1.323601_2_plen_88_part_00